MSAIDETISSFQMLVADVPDIVQPLVVALAAAIPFIEGEGGAIVGVVGGLHPIVAAAAAAGGNFLCVLLVVAVTSRARTAVVGRRRISVAATAGGSGPTGLDDDQGEQDEQGEQGEQRASPTPESKGRQRFKRWVVRFGVPGASILGPLAIPTQFTAAILVGGGTPRRWVLLWQAVAIVIWTSLATVSVWAALTLLVETT
ncbi:small multidrug efflux protein [Demequina muriae]|uniref:Small multidrug efflux protein n=1 Tax=Demequina muriae TaxID=3051664 RepID=A0ABT8GJL8_9MICO|nr:small multidrug efflux protein [Demequina sp. EGI L300058]MDN4481633.1 small multidrug efflux protein [Demequina sp. EGI L300058]